MHMMKRFLAFLCLSGIVLAVVLTVLGLVLSSESVSGAPLVVDDDTGSWADYTTIQDAVDNSSDGDWIWVLTGNYHENVLVNKSVTISGNGTDKTVVEMTGTVFNVTANATIQQMSIEDGTYGVLCTAPEIRLRDLAFPTIDTNAIDITGAGTIVINRVNITSGVRGIRIAGSDNITIKNSSVSGVTLFSIYTFESENITIDDVRITGSTYGIDLAKDTNNTLVRNADVREASNGIMLKDNVNITIMDSVITNCTDGIPITEGFEVVIDNVTIDGATDAITVNDGTVTMTDLWIDSTVQRHIETDDAKISIADSWFTGCDGSFPALYFRDSSAEIADILVIDANAGIGFETSWCNITNSTINTTDMDFELIDTSIVDALNVTFTNASVDATSTFTQRNFLTLYAVNSKGAIEGVDAQITDDGSNVYVTEAFGGSDKKTGTNGMIMMVQVRYRTWSLGGLTYHDIDAGMALGPWSNFTDVNMFFSHMETFTRLYAMDIYVDDNATGMMNGSETDPYDTVMRAHDNATNGDSIHILEGNYSGGLIEKALHMTGETNSSIEFLGIVADDCTLDMIEANHLTIYSAVTGNNITIGGTNGSLEIIGEANLTDVRIAGSMIVSGEAILTNVTVTFGPMTINGMVDWNYGAVYLPESFLFNGSGNLYGVGFYWAENVIISGNDTSIDSCYFNSMLSGILLNGSSTSIHNSTFDMGLRALGNELMITNSTVSGESNFTDSNIEIRDTYVEILNLFNGSLSMRNTSMDRFWMDGFQLDDIELDSNDSVTVDGRGLGYIVNTSDDIDAKNLGFLAVIESEGIVIENATDINLLVVDSADIMLLNASLAQTWCELMVIDSWLDVYESTIEDVVVVRSNIYMQNATVNGPFKLSESFGASYNITFNQMQLQDAAVWSQNSTWAGLELQQNSILYEAMWLQVKVSISAPPAIHLLEDADIIVWNQVLGNEAYATYGEWGNPPTDANGKSEWIILPGEVHNDTEVVNWSYKVTAFDRFSSDNATIQGPGPVHRVDLELENDVPTVIAYGFENENGSVTFNLTLTDGNWDPVSVEIRYSADNMSWYDATILNETEDLSANAIGINYTLTWDSLSDVPNSDGPIYLKFTPADKYSPGLTIMLSPWVNNSGLPHPPEVELLTPQDDAVINSTSVMFSWMSTDHDNDAYSNRLYLDNGTEVFQVHMMNWSSYTVNNLTENVTYEWWVEVSDGRFDVLSEKRNFTINLSAIDRNPPAIVHTPVTLAHEGIALQINAYVYDDVGVFNVTLQYGKGTSWKTLEMFGEIVFSATIPASEISDDFSYYIIASDGRNAVTSPTGDPYEVIVLAPDDDEAPSIDHTPEVNWTYGEPLTITAEVSDDRFVSYVELRYADPRYIYDFTGVEMDRTDGDHMDGTYSAVIPGYAVVPGGVEYWIHATDDFNNATEGSETNPLNASVVVRDRILTTNLSITDGYIEIWASIRGPGDLDVSLTTDPSGGDRADIGLFFTVEIDDPDANVTWVSIEVHYGDLPAGIKARDLRIFHWDAIDERWRYAGITGVDIDGGYVWANLTHLTIFAPMEIPEEEDDKSLVPFLGIAVVIILAVFLAIVFMRHKHAFKKIRERAGKVTCPRCRSEVEDNVSHRCPECGALLPKGSQEEAWEKIKDGPDEEEVEDDGKGLKPLPPMPGTEPKDVGPEFPMGVPRTPGTGPDIKDLEDAGHVERYGSMKTPEKGDEPIVRGARPGPERKDDLGGLKDESEPVKTPEWEDDDTPMEKEPGDDAPGDPDATPEWEGGETEGDRPLDAPTAPDDDGRKTPEWVDDVEEPSDKDEEQ